MVEYEFQEWYKDQVMPSDEELNELEHYGVKGQKWGVRRTPEQLGHVTEKKRKVTSWIEKARKTSAKKKKQAVKKKAAAKKAKAEKQEESEEKIREKVLNSTDPEYIYKNRRLLTTKELQDRLNRIDTETKVKNLADKKTKKGVDAIKVLGDAAKMATSIGAIAESSKKVYDAYNTIYNKRSATQFTKEGRDEQRRKREQERNAEQQKEAAAKKAERREQREKEREEKEKEAQRKRDREMERVWNAYLGKSGSVSADAGLPESSKKKKKK